MDSSSLCVKKLESIEYLEPLEIGFILDPNKLINIDSKKRKGYFFFLKK